MIRNPIRFQELYGEDMDDADIILPPTQKKRGKLRPEDEFQINCLKVIKAYHDIRFIVAQPDRIKNPTMWMRNFLKRLGIFGNLGHPEIILLPPDPAKTALIELKTQYGRMSPHQTDWEAWAKGCGYHHYVIRDLDQLRDVLRRIRK